MIIKVEEISVEHLPKLTTFLNSADNLFKRGTADTGKAMIPFVTLKELKDDDTGRFRAVFEVEEGVTYHDQHGPTKWFLTSRVVLLKLMETIGLFPEELKLVREQGP